MDEAYIAWSEYWANTLDCCSESETHYETMKEEFISEYLDINQ